MSTMTKLLDQFF